MQNLKFDTLGDFEKIKNANLALDARREILTHPNFFLCPTDTDPRTHSELIDEILKINTLSIEQDLTTRAKKIHANGDVKTWGKKLYNGAQTWIGLDPQTLNTPYSEIFDMINRINSKKNLHFIDLGAAYGRMGIILETLKMGHLFTGFELVEERVIEGNRILQELHCQNSTILKQDLFQNDFHLPKADVYFIYDFGTPEHIRKILSDLYKIETNIIVVARGITSRSIVDHMHPWLSQAFAPIHLSTYSIYSNYELGSNT